jgi:hypothetical protein
MVEKATALLGIAYKEANLGVELSMIGQVTRRAEVGKIPLLRRADRPRSLLVAIRRKQR